MLIYYWVNLHTIYTEHKRSTNNVQPTFTDKHNKSTVQRLRTSASFTHSAANPTHHISPRNDNLSVQLQMLLSTWMNSASRCNTDNTTYIHYFYRPTVHRNSCTVYKSSFSRHLTNDIFQSYDHKGFLHTITVWKLASVVIFIWHR